MGYDFIERVGVVRPCLEKMENSTKEEPLNETTPLIKPDSRPIGSTNSINTKLSNGVATGDGISDTDSLLNKELQPDVIPPGRTNVFGATFVVTNAALGAGMLTFPYAFYLAGGWYWGVTTEIVRFFLTVNDSLTFFQ